jgi:hypothetical protein
MELLTSDYKLPETEILNVMNMSTVVFWAVTPCDLRGGYQRFLHLHGLNLHGVTNQKTITDDYKLRITIFLWLYVFTCVKIVSGRFIFDIAYALISIFLY